MEDKKLICSDCGQEFIFSVGEQEFYKEKGLQSDPKRCPDCRKKNKQAKQNRPGNRFNSNFRKNN